LIRNDMKGYNDIGAAVFQECPEGIVILNDSGVLSANGAFADLVGCGTEEIVGRPLDAHLTPEGSRGFAKLCIRVISHDSLERCKTSLVHNDNRRIEVECVLCPVVWAGDAAALIFFRETGRLKEMEQQLKMTTDKLSFFSKWVKKSTAEIIGMNKRLNSEIKKRNAAEKMRDESVQRFRAMAEVIPEVFWMYSHHEKKLLYVSPAFERIYGRPSDEYYRNPELWLQVVHPDDIDFVRESLDNHFGKEREVEYRILHPDWSIRWIRDRIFPVKDEQGEIVHIVGFCEDITGRKHLEEELRLLSITDGLTGLYNQRHFFKKIAEEIERAERISYPLCLLLFDLDNFKQYNDLHGHLKGDDLLREVGRVTQKVIRKGVDTAFRYGGDEFVIIFPNMTEEGARVLEKRIRLVIREEIHEIGISVGISQLKEHDTAETFIDAADNAMYLDKEMRKKNKHLPPP